jgi:hypothetical protein
MKCSWKSWLRRVYPPWWVILVPLFILLVMESLRCWVDRGLDVPDVAVELGRMRDALLLVCAALYGGFRVLRFHPAFLPGYAAWLSATPWTFRQPLPKGPVRLIVQDAILLTVLFLIAHGAANMIPRIVVAFLVPYLLLMAVSFAYTGARPFTYALIFGFGLAAQSHETPVRAACWLVLLYLVAWGGLRQSLARFPWQLEQAPWRQITNGKGRQDEIRLGWPCRPMFLKEPKNQWGTWDRIALSVLAGWWLYVVAGLFPPAQQGYAAMNLCVLVSAIAVAARVATYCATYWPPISICGRLWTGRWIIPGYDRVLVAPLCAAAVFALTALTHSSASPSNGSLCSLGVTAVLLVVTLMGPSYRNWALTGSHRIVDPTSSVRMANSVRRR